MRAARVDALKAVAVLAVLLLHSLPEEVGARGIGWWLAQAVPIFAVLLGYNATRMRLGPEYWRRRARRIYAPFLAVFVLAFLVEPSAKALNGLVTGTLPTQGPGNYFVTLLFQFVVAAPALLWAHRRYPRVFLGACLAISFAWEFVPTGSYVYEAALPKWIAFIALGMALASGLPRWWRAGLAVSVAYLATITIWPAFPFGPDGWTQTGETVLGAFFTVALVKLALERMPAVATTLGRASYHVFLVQIGYFWLVPDRGLGEAFEAVLVCCAAGLVFWHLDQLAAGVRVRRGRVEEAARQPA